MATLRKKRKVEALIKESCEEHPGSNLAQNTNVPRSQEDYITQVCDEIEGRVTKKLSKEFSKMENRILGALSRLDEFLLSPLIQGYSGFVPETSRNALGENQWMNEDDSQSDPHPEPSVSQSQTTQNSGPDDGYDSNLDEKTEEALWRGQLRHNWDGRGESVSKTLQKIRLSNIMALFSGKIEQRMSDFVLFLRKKLRSFWILV